MPPILLLALAAVGLALASRKSSSTATTTTETTGATGGGGTTTAGGNVFKTAADAAKTSAAAKEVGITPALALAYQEQCFDDELRASVSLPGLVHILRLLHQQTSADTLITAASGFEQAGNHKLAGCLRERAAIMVK